MLRCAKISLSLDKIGFNLVGELLFGDLLLLVDLDPHHACQPVLCLQEAELEALHQEQVVKFDLGNTGKCAIFKRRLGTPRHFKHCKSAIRKANNAPFGKAI